MMAEQRNQNIDWPEEDSDHDDSSPSTNRTFFSTWGWPLFGLAAWLVFELTASSMISSFVISIRFGWKDVFTGMYLWWVDPVRARGRALGLMHLASAMGKTYFSAFVLWGLLSGLIEDFGPPAGWDAETFGIVFGLITVGGMCGCCLATLLAVWIAWRSRLKLWVESTNYEAAIRREWPPTAASVNSCGCITILAMTGAAIFSLVALICVWMNIMEANPDHEGAIILVGAPLLFGAVLLFIASAGFLDGLVAAKSPTECWPEQHVLP